MSQLAKLQNDFQAYLYDDLKGAAFKARIVNDRKVGAKKRLGIYFDAYRLRIIEVLGNDYPMLKKWLGNKLFESTARSYIDQYPSTNWNMRWVGQHMHTHLIKILPQHPVASELAMFEWALGLAFDAEDTLNLSLQDLAKIPAEDWGKIKLKANPSVQLFNFQYNTIDIWKALNKNKTPPKPSKSNSHFIVWRKGLDSHYRLVEPLEVLALEKVLLEVEFGELCEFLHGDHVSERFTEEAAIQLAAQYLSGWLTDSLISNIS